MKVYWKYFICLFLFTSVTSKPPIEQPQNAYANDTQHDHPGKDAHETFPSIAQNPDYQFNPNLLNQRPPFYFPQTFYPFSAPYRIPYALPPPPPPPQLYPPGIQIPNSFPPYAIPPPSVQLTPADLHNFIGHVITLPQLPPPVNPNCASYYGIQRVCKERSTCFHFFGLYANIDPASTCLLPDKTVGVCCSVDDFSFALAPYAVDDFYEDLRVTDHHDSGVYDDAYRQGRDSLKKLHEREEKVFSQGRHLNPEDIDFQRHQDIQKSTKEAREQADHGYVLNAASQILIQKYGNGPKSPYIQLWNNSLSKTCRPPIQCGLFPYRSYDGTCNNLKYPYWGSTNSVLTRLLPPDYADGMSAPRRAHDKSELPSSRFLSLTLAEDVSKPHPAITHMFMAFGQYVAHDMTQTAVSTGPNGESIPCCKQEQWNNPESLHPECFPIPIPENDPLLSGKKCMNFIRSLPAQTDNCKILYHREQMNQVTSFLDVSFVYGSSDEVARSIRTFSEGLLQVSIIKEQELLPVDHTIKNCGNPNEGYYCFKGGDNRLNQEPPILSLHILYVRQHNYVARQLAKLNNWDDEILFQEARKVVIAQLQHIAFNEFLPLVLDYDTRQKYGLLLKADGYSSNYDPRLKPNVVNSFMVAAFRFGHSTVQNLLQLFKGGFHHSTERLEDNYFNPRLIYPRGNLEMILQGLVIDNAQNADEYFSRSMSRFLFKSPTSIGLDIYAINLQRGRDNGIPGYNFWRKRCGLKEAKTFYDFSDTMSVENANSLGKTYKHVNDVDLYVGGMKEKPFPGSLVGPTFRCIIADQFRRVRLADRFWYERYSAEENVGFTPEQLQEIRKTTLARILCDNSEIKLIQPLAFLKPSFSNPGVGCDSNRIPTLNFQSWKDDKY